MMIPYRLIFSVIFSVTIGEFLIMLLLPNIKGLSASQSSLLDASALSIFSSIIVFFIAVLPLEKRVKKLSDSVADLALERSHIGNAMMAKALKYPRRLMLVLSLGIFVAQFMIMANLEDMANISNLSKAVIDAFLTFMFTLVLLFVSVILPMEERITKLYKILEIEKN